MRKINKKQNGFSLVEVLISLVLISLVMVAMAPVITKKVSIKKADGIVYKYSDANNTTSTSDVCFRSVIGDTYEATTECSEYVFTVPDGVTHINLTLVAGGGGGGGAAGGTIAETTLEKNSGSTVSSTDNSSQAIPSKVVINYLSAEGSDGGNTNSSCINEGEVCGGAGGASSSAFVNLEIPADIVKLLWTTDKLTASNSIATSATIGDSSSSFSALMQGSETTTHYGFNYLTGSCSVYEDSSSGTTGNSSYCGIIDDKNFLSASGESGQSLTDSQVTTIVSKICSGSTSTTENYILSGGAGGKINSPYGQYGSGGAGDTAVMKINCKDKTHSTTTATSDSLHNLSGQSGYARVVWQTKTANGRGGGGSGAAAVRISGFNVNPGEQYIIRVGKGGNGGKAGITGTSSTATAGTAGEGGVTTAIYDSSGTLIYMVNGGVGGSGGEKDKDVVADSNRIYPKLFSANLSANDSNTDTDFVKISSSGTGNSPSVSNIKSFNLSYPLFEEEPFDTLNGEPTDNTIGGFSSFYKNSSSLTSHDAEVDGNPVKNIYDGFYYKRILNNTQVYTGGLGGFSGLGTKAGCGGFFGGNTDGRNSGDTSGAVSVKNQFLVDNTSGLFSVSKYYDNCTTTTPDGQSAKFVDPNPFDLTLGQAGSGGGGGGWSIESGSGNGGDGQDGYLMIDWRK